MSPVAKRKTRRLLVGRAGLWLVLFAVFLSALGLVLAVQQSNRLGALLTLQARNLAVEIANKARAEIALRLEAVMERLQRFESDSAANARTSPEGLPAWVRAVYVWRGDRLIPAFGAEPAPGHLAALIASRVGDGRPPVVPILADRVQLILDAEQGRRGMFAVETPWRSGDPDSGWVVELSGPMLVREIVEPLLQPVFGLELVSSGEPLGAPWVQPLSLSGGRESPHYWELRPTAEYVAGQTSAVRWQTWFHLGLTAVSLMTLLVTMLMLIRVTRREIDLAEMKANFVADVSHELKTPLAVLRLYGETLQSGRIQDEAKRQEYYAVITRECARLTNMIHNILDFARIEAGRAEYRFKPTDVGQVVAETFEAFRPELDRAGFQRHLSIEPGLPFVNADRDAIVQILFNLLSNATKYSEEEKFVGVEVTGDTLRGRRGIAILVSDRGIGISPEDRLHLFEGFYRSRDDRVRKRSGAGLGLALVKHIVDAHQGSIDVEARLVRGTTFRIFLPASEVPGSADRTALIEETGPSGAALSSSPTGPAPWTADSRMGG